MSVKIQMRFHTPIKNIVNKMKPTLMKKMEESLTKNLMSQKPEVEPIELPEPSPHPSEHLLTHLKLMGGIGKRALSWVDILVDEIFFLRTRLNHAEKLLREAVSPGTDFQSCLWSNDVEKFLDEGT